MILIFTNDARSSIRSGDMNTRASFSLSSSVLLAAVDVFSAPGVAVGVEERTGKAAEEI